MTADAELDSGPVVLQPGSIIAERYRIIDILGHGGMGVVYKAQHIHMDKFVAVKMMLQPNSAVSSQDYRRFQREAQAASMVDHPNIVSIHDFGYFDKQAYLCMDYLSGTSLDQLLNQAPLKLDEFRHIFRQVCDALQHAHDKGLIHRDLKPSNIMITERRNDPLFPVILDLGLVKLINGGDPEKSDHKLTMTNMVVGSPLYMSPEQCRAHQVDHRSDIYSLGCVMYEALTGVPPLRADTLFDIMSKHISETPKPLRDEAKGVYVPVALERAIFKAMAKSPDERAQTMKELAQSIEHAFSGAPEVIVPRSGSGSTSGVVPVGGASLTTKKKAKKQNQLLIGLSIAFGTMLMFMIPAGIMYNDYIQKEKNNHQATPGAVQVGPNSSGNQNPVSAPNSPINSLFSNPLFSGANKAQPSSTSLVKPALGVTTVSPNSTNSPGALPGVAYTPGGAPPPNSANNPSSTRPTGAVETAAASQPEVSFSSPARPFIADSPKAPTLESVLKDADFAYARREYSEARQKYSEALNMRPSRDVYGQIAAKLTMSCYQLRDLAAAKQYLDGVKETYGFNTVNTSNYPQYWELVQVGVQAGDRDPAFNEKILTDIINAHERKIVSPDRDLIRMRLELNRAYIDQGKMDESRALLNKTLADANPFPEEAANIKQHISQLFPVRPAARGDNGGSDGGPQGGFSGPGGGMPGSGGFLGGPPPFGGPGGGPPGGGPPGGGFGGPPGGPGQGPQ